MTTCSCLDIRKNCLSLQVLGKFEWCIFDFNICVDIDTCVSDIFPRFLVCVSLHRGAECGINSPVDVFICAS